MFEINKRDGLARLGRIKTKHGVLDTPTLLPVVNPKIMTLSMEELSECGAQGIITNSYIIYKNPKLKEIAEEQGVHGLVNWLGPIMTDSGTFQSHVYGEIEMKPEEILDFQKKIKVDIGTVLDVFCEPETRFEDAKRELAETQRRIEESDKNKGSIFLERRSNVPFSKMDENNLLLIGKVLGSALHWKNEYEKIYMDATHDGLSGLLNHQTFKERFQDEVMRAERFQHKMAIMIFDLDKFKKVNDTLGHQYGDYVIQTVAKIMLDNVRAVDVVARYGGEEFAIILINTTAAMSNVVAKRIVSNIADYKFSMDKIETRVTISGGMSEYPTHTKIMKELIEYADQAMYKTKQNGGNDITIHEAL